MNRAMDRKDFIKTAGVGTVALGALAGAPAALGSHLTDRRAYRLVAFSGAATVHGVEHRIGLNGCGHFSAHAQRVDGGGQFVHLDNAPPTPKPLLAFGDWRPTRFVGFTTGFGIWGSIEASFLDLLIELLPAGGSPVSASFRLICNIGPAGITTGQNEGFILSIPGAPFGDFVPLLPPVGITAISTVGAL